MPFPQSFLDELMARSDIVDVVGSYVQLTRKGANLFGLCPFHSEKTGSFSVSPDKQIYYCFGCKRGGGVINFIMEEENLSFPDAVRFLAKRAGMEVPEEDGDREAGRRRQRLLDLNRDAARFYYQMLQQPEGRAVQEYLDRRKIRRATAVNFGLGASLDALGRADPGHDEGRAIRSRSCWRQAWRCRTGTAACTTSSATGSSFLSSMCGETWWPSAAGSWTSLSLST